MKFESFKNWVFENIDSKITILFPGSYKPIHGGHVNLINQYVLNPNVKEVKVLIGSGNRDGISQDVAVKIAQELLGTFEKISVEKALYPSPILTAYKYIETAKPGVYALGGSTKGDDYERVKKFDNEHQEKGKYFNTKPSDVKVIELIVNTKPLIYNGRNDEYEGQPISASILRKDLLNDDFENFKTNYPEFEETTLLKIWKILKQHISENLNTLNTTKLFEGGNIFDDTTSIKKEHIQPTIDNFKQELKKQFPKVNFQFDILGSGGKKPISGDIDLALSDKTILDEHENPKNLDWNISDAEFEEFYQATRKRARTATEKQSKIHTMSKLISQKFDEVGILCDTKKSGSGTVFCSSPQIDEKGNNIGTNVQIDINIGDLDWLRFSYYSETYEGNVKGLHRTQLLVALFANKQKTFRHGTGVYDLSAEKYIAQSPLEAINLMNELYGFKKEKLNSSNINNFFKLHDFLIKNLNTDELYKVYDIYLKILDSTRTDVPSMLQDYWIENQERLKLQGKFLPEESNLYKFKTA